MGPGLFIKRTPVLPCYFRKAGFFLEKKVIIRCTSSQRDETGRAETITLDTLGVYGEAEDHRYISYEETSLSGLEGTTTTIRLFGDKVTLSRRGTFVQETEYIPGKESESEYMTPAGPMKILTTPREIYDTVKDGTGEIRLVYDIEMKGLFKHLNEIVIEVREEQDASWKSEKN